MTKGRLKNKFAHWVARPESSKGVVTLLSHALRRLRACHTEPRWVIQTRRPQAGMVSLAIVVGLVLLVAFFVLALNMGFARYSYQQLQVACDAAALAGAGQLMEDFPREWDVSAWRAVSWGTGMPKDQTVESIAAARGEAVYFASRNSVAGMPLVLDANTANDPSGDIIVGRTDEPTGLGPLFVPAGPGEPANSILVRGRRTRATQNPLSLWMAHWLGVPDVELVATAQAAVDQRVHGFQPAGHVAVPMVPLLVTIEGNRVTWPNRGQALAEKGHEDRFSVNGRTAEVCSGADGIDEITLRFGGGPEQDTNDNVLHGAQHAGSVDWVLVLDGLPIDRDRLEHQIRFGLTGEDLSPTGGRFVLGAGGGAGVPAIKLSDCGQLATIRSALLDIRGQKRIWPLGHVPNSRHESERVCKVVGFAAGQVVDLVAGSASAVHLVIQPCWLQTPTALVGAGISPNPWIGKLVLVR